MRPSWRKRSAAFCCAFCLSLFPAAAEEPRVTLHLENAPVRELLQNLAEMAHRNIIFSGEMKGRITANLENITADEALMAVIAADGLAVRDTGKVLIIYDGSLKGRSPTAETFRLSYADAKEVAETLKDIYQDKRIAHNAGANTVIFSGSAEELLQARHIIDELDKPEVQVKVEAEVLSISKNGAKELGIDWDFKSLTGSADYSRDTWSEQHYVTNDAGEVLYDSDGNPRIRNIEHSGWNVTIPDGYAGISYGTSAAGHPYTFFFQAALNALISEGKAEVLARPNVVTMNGRTAEILIGSEIPVVVEHMENGVKTTGTEYKDAGIKLSYTPRVSRDNEITATVRAEVSTPYLVSEMKAYRLVTRQAETMVRLRSGDELVIGGLIDREESYTFRKVPILGDIPLLGKLFQSKSRSVEETEIIIVIRADIVTPEVATRAHLKRDTSIQDSIRQYNPVPPEEDPLDQENYGDA